MCWFRRQGWNAEGARWGSRQVAKPAESTPAVKVDDEVQDDRRPVRGRTMSAIL